jgi:hypothetical protein
MTKTYEEKEEFRKPPINSRRILVGRGSSGNSSGSMNSDNNSQLSTPCAGGGTTNFTMAGHDPTIQLPKFMEKGWRTLRSIFLVMKDLGS